MQWPRFDLFIGLVWFVFVCVCVCNMQLVALSYTVVIVVCSLTFHLLSGKLSKSNTIALKRAFTLCILDTIACLTLHMLVTHTYS